MKRLIAAILAVGALAAAALPSASLATKLPAGSAGSCGTNSATGFFFKGGSPKPGSVLTLQDCTPNNP